MQATRLHMKVTYNIQGAKNMNNQTELSNEHDKIFKRVAIYSRKSKFTGKGESIENQIEMCKQYLKFNFIDDWENMQIEIFEDEGFSGGNTNRPQFQNMMNKIENKEFDAVICYKLDRISRNTRDFIDIVETFKKYNVDFISLKDKFDTSTPAGRAMMLMVSVFSQLERETIAERIRDNMRELSKTGRWLGGTAPTGYTSVRTEKMNINGKKKTVCKLEIDENTIQNVLSIYNKFLEVNSLAKTETYLLQNNIKTTNNRNYTRHSIKTILENPVYAIADEDTYKYFSDSDCEIYLDEKFDGVHGIMPYNRTEQDANKIHRLKPINEWVITVGEHRGVITGYEWVKVQNMLKQNTHKGDFYRKSKSNVALLSGLLRCGKCNSPMRPKLSAGLNKDKQRMYYYLCETKEKSKGVVCDMKNINGNELDKAVCEEVLKLSYNDSEFYKQLKNMSNKINNTDYDVEIKKLQQQIAKNNKTIERAVEKMLNAENNEDEVFLTKHIKEKIKSLENENIDLERKIDEIKCLIKDYDLSNIEIIKDELRTFSRTFDTMTMEEKRNTLRLLIRKVVWDGENVHIYFFGNNDDEMIFTDSNGSFPQGNNSKL